MAITQTYVDYGAGNDYKGATFTDGAYTSATKTLVKLNAFAASKVNHWLKLSSNAGGSIVTGYYKIATWTDASTVILATDAGAGSDATDVKCTQHDGTTTLPYRSIQGALDLITRNATDGDQINVKAGTTQVNAAALTLATYGTPTGNAPLIMRGYTTAAYDGGYGEIDANGAAMFAATTYDWIALIDLLMHNFGNNHGVVLDDNCLVWRCKATKGASSPSYKYMIGVGDNSAVVQCYVYDGGTTGGGIYSVAPAFISYNYVSACNWYGIRLDVGGSVTHNIIRSTATAAWGLYCASAQAATFMGNIAYNTSAGTACGIRIAESASHFSLLCRNNIIVGWSGVGGKGIGTSGGASVDAYLFGSNAFYNCTGNYGTIQLFVDETSSDVALAADPFTDAANGDFSLTAAAKTALAAKGWPAAYLGAHANTVPNLNIGPIQLAAAAAAGGLLRHPGMAGGCNA